MVSSFSLIEQNQFFLEPVIVQAARKDMLTLIENTFS